jgi:tetratricopeptide (TPR) repeat protein
MKKISLSVAACVIFLTLMSDAFGQTASNPDVDQVVQLNNQVLAFNKRGQYSQSVELGIKVLKLSEDTLGSDNPNTARILNNLGVAYDGLGDFANAEPLLQRGLVIREKSLGSEDPITAESVNDLAAHYQKMGAFANADKVVRKCGEASKIRNANLPIEPQNGLSRRLSLAFRDTVTPPKIGLSYGNTKSTRPRRARSINRHFQTGVFTTSSNRR